MVEFEECKDANELGIIGLCKGSPNLKKLSLKYRGRVGFTDAVVLAVTTHCPDIEVLSLNGWWLVSDAAMAYLGSLSSLKEVCLCLCPNLTSAGVQNLIKANNNLEVLILSEIDEEYMYSAEPFIDAALLACIGNHCPRLIKLQLTIPEEGSDVTDAILTTMLAGCPLLEELILGEFNKPNNVMPTLAAHCTHLKRLLLFKVDLTAAGVALVCKHCPELRSLKLVECHRLIDGDNAVFAIAAYCPKLQEFTLTCNSTVHDESLCALFKACTDLRAVRLELNIRTTGQSTLTLLQSCHKLKCLNVEVFKCTDISSLGIATYGKALEHLKLSSELQDNDDPVVLISKSCPRLKTITLYHCFDITESCVRAVLANCPHLVELRVMVPDGLTLLSAEFKTECEGIGERYRGPRLTWEW